MKPGGRMHALVEIGILRIDMTVEVDDPQVATPQVLRHRPHRGIANGVVAPKDNGQGATGVDMGDGMTNLIERLLG